MDNKTFIETLGKRINAGKDETSEMVSSLCKVLADAALEGIPSLFRDSGVLSQENGWSA